MKIIFLKGLPASGKSTWAKEQVQKNENIKRVNKDDLREMIDGGKWSKTREKHILEVRDWFIAQCLEHGHDVIVDDTNFAAKHEERIREIAKQYNATVEVKIFDTPLEECERVVGEMERKQIILSQRLGEKPRLKYSCEELEVWEDCRSEALKRLSELKK